VVYDECVHALPVSGMVQFCLAGGSDMEKNRKIRSAKKNALFFEVFIFIDFTIIAKESDQI
jgi:hypothetical protein